MPLYEYACAACGRVTEALQRIGDPPLAECPHCGGPLRRLVSAPAIQFKGSGWYVTDYARKGGGSGSGGGRRSAGGEETGSGTADKPAPAAPESGAQPAAPAPAKPAKPTSGE